MFLACGVGAYGAAIFHLYTHAFFKALLFLGAGSVMHAMQGELDIMKMGGLKKHMPKTYWTFLLASISIAGIPGLAGFFSKDEILWMAFASGGVGKIVWAIGAFTALLTAFYSFRIVYLAFHGEFRGGQELESHLHESPPSMTIPLIILAIGAVAAGWVGIPHALWGHNQIGEFLGHVVGHPEVHGSVSAERFLMVFSSALAVIGIVVAFYFYRKRTDIPGKLAEKYSGVHHLLWNKYFIDEIYDATIVQTARGIARNVIVAVTDGKIIEGVVNGVPRLIGRTGQALRLIQNGLIHRYAAIMGLGFILVLAIAFLW